MKTIELLMYFFYKTYTYLTMNPTHPPIAVPSFSTRARIPYPRPRKKRGAGKPSSNQINCALPLSLSLTVCRSTVSRFAPVTNAPVVYNSPRGSDSRTEKIAPVTPTPARRRQKRKREREVASVVRLFRIERKEWMYG